MSEAKHTPGPWVITRGQQEPTSKAGHMFVRQGPGVYGAFVCHVHPRNGEATETEVVYDAEAEANARLIAAAPEMLAALTALYDATTDGRNELIRSARVWAIKAIGKATEANQ